MVSTIDIEAMRLCSTIQISTFGYLFSRELNNYDIFKIIKGVTFDINFFSPYCFN